MGLFKKILQFLDLTTPPRDGDGDGKIFDGTAFEKAAPIKEKKKPVKKTAKKPAKKPAKKAAKKAAPKKKAKK